MVENMPHQCCAAWVPRQHKKTPSPSGRVWKVTCDVLMFTLSAKFNEHHSHLLAAVVEAGHVTRRRTPVRNQRGPSGGITEGGSSNKNGAVRFFTGMLGSNV